MKYGMGILLLVTCVCYELLGHGKNSFLSKLLTLNLVKIIRAAKDAQKNLAKIIIDISTTPFITKSKTFVIF